MKLLLVCPYDWEAPGGVQVHIRDQAAALRAAGHDVRVIAPSSRATAEDGVVIVGRPVRVPYKGTIAPIAPSPAQRGPLRRAIAAFGPDVVHVHEPLTLSTSSYATLVSPVPVVATFHAFAEHSNLVRYGAPLVRPIWNRLAERIAVSDPAADYVSGPLRPRPVVIPNGVDVAAFASAQASTDLPAGRRVLWVNRLDRQKGFAVALEAFARLVREHPDAVLIVAGDGPDRGLVERTPPEVRQRITMLGSVPHADLAPIYAAADVFIAPATGQESFGIVLVEAMAAGVPVVASDIAGYRSVARNGLDARLVRAEDPGALATAVGEVLADPTAAAAMAAAGRERAAEFAWERVIPRLEAIYERVRRG